tara:strand:- start:10107 stop:11003 length:897 start_codon:yes stop_codon:yes gene_type:complete
MAKLPVGYRSPFNKISSVKPSPAKIAWTPAMTQIAMAAAPGIIGAVGSLFGRRRRRQEQRDARKKLEQAKKAFENIEYKNPYADLTNPYVGMENVYEDATVDTRAADYLKEQQQQSQANILSNLKGVAGGSGVAGLAQQMSNISAGQAKQASMQIAQQERANQQRSMAESSRLDQLQRTGQSRVDVAKMQGEAMRQKQEQARIGALYGLSIDRMDAADKARQTARSNFLSGLGQAAGGVAGLYAPGGSLYGTLGGTPDYMSNISVTNTNNVVDNYNPSYSTPIDGYSNNQYYGPYEQE